VPETKGVPLESIYMLFEGSIVAGATRDTVPKHSRARHLTHASNVETEPDSKGSMSSHVERVEPSAKNVAYGLSTTSQAI
jgi:SP family sugar:H+ symporter-like MFS transporter